METRGPSNFSLIEALLRNWNWLRERYLSSYQARFLLPASWLRAWAAGLDWPLRSDSEFIAVRAMRPYSSQPAGVGWWIVLLDGGLPLVRFTYPKLAVQGILACYWIKKGSWLTVSGVPKLLVWRLFFSSAPSAVYEFKSLQMEYSKMKRHFTWPSSGRPGSAATIKLSDKEPYKATIKLSDKEPKAWHFQSGQKPDNVPMTACLWQSSTSKVILARWSTWSSDDFLQAIQVLFLIALRVTYSCLNRCRDARAAACLFLWMTSPAVHITESYTADTVLMQLVDGGD